MTARRAIVNSLITLTMFAIIWEFTVWLVNVPLFLLPPPSIVAKEFVYHGQLILWHTSYTLLVTLVGFGIGIITGVVTASGIVMWRLLENYLYPIIVATQVMPKVAIAPLLLIWFGYGLMSKYVIVFLICFFPILVATVSGLKAVERELIDLSLSLNASKWKIFRKVRFPNSIPYIFIGLRVGITTAVIGAVVGEFVGGDRGLGYLIIISNTDLNTKMVFAALVVLALMGMILFGIILLAEKILVPWAPDSDEMRGAM